MFKNSVLKKDERQGNALKSIFRLSAL